MPVYLDKKPPSSEFTHCAKVLGRSPLRPRRSAQKTLEIGIVNNMPDGAVPATERQLVTLLDSAAGAYSIRLTFYALPGVPRSESVRRHLDACYSSVEELWDRQLDGLIVTGAEPRTPHLSGESYWPSFTKLVQWAELHTYSSIWSCLAAHAAVLYLDGIERRRLVDKRFGLFSCVPQTEHLLTAGLSSPIVIPHSRWNDLFEQDLFQSGYQILTRSDEAGVDSFVKHGKSLFVFFQGHPEYEANSLFLEYQRDVGRYLRGQRESYPQMPRRYFDRGTEAVLQAVQARALQRRSEDVLADFPNESVEGILQNGWHSAATTIYRNWLAYLSACQDGRLDTSAREPLREAVLVRRFAAGANKPIEI